MRFGDRLRAAGSILLGRETGLHAQTPLEGQMIDLKDPEAAELLRGGIRSESNAIISHSSVLTIGTAWRCASLISGLVADLPCDLMLREDERTRVPAVDEPFREVLTTRPNNRQTPAEFKTMLQLHKLQVGNGYAMKIRSMGRIVALWPLDPTRMQVIENVDLSLTYRYSRRDGSLIDFAAGEIMHLRGMSWDGITGLSTIRFMAEAAGLAIQTRRGAAKMLKNGQITPGFIKTAHALSDKAYGRLLADFNENAGVDAGDAGRMRILEEGLEFQQSGLSASDAQLVETIGLTRDDIGMFYGVPPFMYGDTQKSTSWGTGLSEQRLGFLQFTLNPHLRDWREVVKRDCLGGLDPRLYVHFDDKGFLRAAPDARSQYLARALGAGGTKPWMTQNEARASEDMPPSKEPWADVLAEFGSGKPVETSNGNKSGAGEPQQG